MAEINPLRYRSYYYDTETGFYYLQSRYYDPNTCRFINADSYASTGQGFLGYNMFAYCGNNPILFKDSEGESITVACIIIGVTIGTILGGMYGESQAQSAGYTMDDGWDYWKPVVGYGFLGGIAGGVSGWGVGSAITAVSASSTMSAVSTSPTISLTGTVKMQNVYAKGKAGEIASGIVKNSQHIPSLSKTASYRIPDGLDHANRILSEVKNYSGKLSYTAQLRDYVMWSQSQSVPYQIHLYTNAQLTAPLKQVVDKGIITVIQLR